MYSFEEIIGHLINKVPEELTGHSKFLSVLAYIVAKQLKEDHPELKLDDLFADHMKIASKLHDLGKINIDKNILNKPDKLTTEEYRIMKMHTVYGLMVLTEMTKGISLDINERKLFTICKEVILLHHEREDGSGYPIGINRIPLSAQIMAVVDTYDALTTNRVYHNKVTKEEALEILDHDDDKYNPMVVDSLKRVLAKKDFAEIVNNPPLKEVGLSCSYCR
ncbi:HD domain-containing phosphohydrolase [Erysipelatoclostridium sp. An173]|uniref:HD-GYP domain-containing protein n=1 Tax=Erysipelatoclostridium sp. An173 TaxID=1965571 RepID=UPI003209EDE1